MNSKKIKRISAETFNGMTAAAFVAQHNRYLPSKQYGSSLTTSPISSKIWRIAEDSSMGFKLVSPMYVLNVKRITILYICKISLKSNVWDI